MDAEVTLLAGATERDRKLVPTGVEENADNRRALLAGGQGQRQLYTADQ